MKLITPFTILNRKFNEMDLIRDVMKNRRLATERLHEDYRKMYKNYQFALILLILVNFALSDSLLRSIKILP